MANETIYVVTKGSYSDYHIVAVTLNKEIAEKIAAKFSNDWDECKIEEYGDAEVMLKPAWYIYFDKNGNVCDTTKCDSDYDYHNIGEVYGKNHIYYGGNYHIAVGQPSCYVVVSADNRESAIKIAAEKRAKYLAEKLGL